MDIHKQKVEYSGIYDYAEDRSCSQKKKKKKVRSFKNTCLPQKAQKLTLHTSHPTFVKLDKLNAQEFFPMQADRMKKDATTCRESRGESYSPLHFWTGVEEEAEHAEMPKASKYKNPSSTFVHVTSWQ